MIPAYLHANEDSLTGSWVSTPTGVVGDATCDRIELLIEGVLRHLADSPECGAWESLFEDPADGRLWERTYPRGHMHGGGPPALRVIAPADARGKYRW
jgi:Immunity protein 27